MCQPSLTFLLLALLALRAGALRFYLHDRERRCFNFDAPFSSRVLGERSVANGPGRAVLHMHVHSATGRVVHESTITDSTPAKFAFNTADYHVDHRSHMDDEYDYEPYELDSTYSVCLLLTFDAHHHVESASRAVSFWVRPEARSGPHTEPKATEGSMGAVTSAMEQMDQTLKGMVSELSALEQRERRLVVRTEATAFRLVSLACLSLLVVFATATLQFFHFKTYFKAKKLI